MRIEAHASRGAMPKNFASNSIDAAQEPAPARVHLARGIRIGIVVSINVPPVGWHLGDRIDAVAQQPPERLRAGDAARKTALIPDNGDRLRRACPPAADAERRNSEARRFGERLAIRANTSLIGRLSVRLSRPSGQCLIDPAFGQVLDLFEQGAQVRSRREPGRGSPVLSGTRPAPGKRPTRQGYRIPT